VAAASMNRGGTQARHRRGDGGSDSDATTRLAAIVESSQDAIISKTLAGVITSWSVGAEQMYGYSRDEMIGHNIAELVPSNRAGELGPIIARIARGESVHHFDTQRVTKDGRLLDMSIAMSPIRGADGTVTSVCTVARDVTDITRALDYRHSLEDQLRLFEAKIAAYECEPVVGADKPAIQQLRPTHCGLGADLTPRELEVLQMMAGGMLNKQVARRLGLRLNTVRNHSQSILCKLQAHSRLEAVATAVRSDIIAYPSSTAVS
jgi:PAS domain S-box-containing protein